jgi:hypothetical protein
VCAIRDWLETRIRIEISALWRQIPCDTHARWGQTLGGFVIPHALEIGWRIPHVMIMPLDLALAFLNDADSDATLATGWGRSRARAM